MPNIAFVDDATMIRSAISKLIETTVPSHKVYQYCHGRDFIDRFPNEGYEPSLVLMDISMPLVNGYETTEWFKCRFPHIPVLVVSLLDNEANMMRMLRHGASGFVAKHMELEVLFEAMEQVRAGHFYFNVGREYRVVKKVLYENGRKLGLDDVIFTGREEDILKMIGTGKTYSNIAEELGITFRTVEKHKANIADKLNIHTREGLVLYAIKSGLVHY